MRTRYEVIGIGNENENEKEKKYRYRKEDEIVQASELSPSPLKSFHHGNEKICVPRYLV